MGRGAFSLISYWREPSMPVAALLRQGSDALPVAALLRQ